MRTDKETSPVFPSAIRHAYDLLLAGVSLGSIAGTWNAAGLPAGPDGGPAPSGLRGTWTADGVRTVLAEAEFAGSLVDESTWRSASALLSAPSRHGPAQSDPALLTAIACCGVCGRPVRSKVLSPGQVAYRCGGERIHLARSCGPIDAEVRLQVLDRLRRPGAPELVADRSTTPELPPPRLRSVGLRRQPVHRTVAGRPATVEHRSIRPVRNLPLDNAWDTLAVSRQRGVLLALTERIELHPIPPGQRAGDPGALRQSVLITWRAR